MTGHTWPYDKSLSTELQKSLLVIQVVLQVILRPFSVDASRRSMNLFIEAKEATTKETTLQEPVPSDRQLNMSQENWPHIGCATKVCASCQDNAWNRMTNLELA